MSQAIRKPSAFAFPVSQHLVQRLREGILIALGGIALFLLIALLTHHPTDPGWSQAGSSNVVHNEGGMVGAWVADIALYLFGQFAYGFPLLVGYLGWMMYDEGAEEFFSDYFHLSVRFVGISFTLVTGCGLFWVRGGGTLADSPHHAGGILGDVVGAVTYTTFGELGGVLLMVAVFFTGVTLFTGLSWLWLMDTVGGYALRASYVIRAGYDRLLDYWCGLLAKRERVALVKRTPCATKSARRRGLSRASWKHRQVSALSAKNKHRCSSAQASPSYPN